MRNCTLKSKFVAAQLAIVAAISIAQTVPASAEDANPSAGHRVKVGLALGGGGSRGSAEVGVLKVLKEEGIPIDIIAGTSIGAVVGGFYAAGVPLDELSEEFLKAKFMKIFMPLPLYLRVLIAPITSAPRLLGHHPYDGLYPGKQIVRAADRIAGPEKDTIEKLPIPFAAVCTNLRTGLSHRITKGDLGLAMAASSAVPGLKKPLEIDGELYCDGGLVCNLPVNHVKEMGADFVIAIDIDENLKKDIPLKTFRRIGAVSDQALRISLATTDRPLSKDADFVIHPDTDGIDLISRKGTDGKRGIEAGIKAARAAMPELKRKLAAAGVVLVGTSTDATTR